MEHEFFLIGYKDTTLYAYACINSTREKPQSEALEKNLKWGTGVWYWRLNLAWPLAYLANEPTLLEQEHGVVLNTKTQKFY